MIIQTEFLRSSAIVSLLLEGALSERKCLRSYMYFEVEFNPDSRKI